MHDPRTCFEPICRACARAEQAAGLCTWCYHPRDIHDARVHVTGGVWCAACANQTCRPPDDAG